MVLGCSLVGCDAPMIVPSAEKTPRSPEPVRPLPGVEQESCGLVAAYSVSLSCEGNMAQAERRSGSCWSRVSRERRTSDRPVSSMKKPVCATPALGTVQGGKTAAQSPQTSFDVNEFFPMTIKGIRPLVGDAAAATSCPL